MEVYLVYSFISILVGLQDGIDKKWSHNYQKNPAMYAPYVLLLMGNIWWFLTAIYHGQTYIFKGSLSLSLLAEIPMYLLMWFGFIFIIAKYYNRWKWGEEWLGGPLLVVLSLLIGWFYGYGILPLLIMVIPMAVTHKTIKNSYGDDVYTHRPVGLIVVAVHLLAAILSIINSYNAVGIYELLCY